jgi:hypothetical protein
VPFHSDCQTLVPIITCRNRSAEEIAEKHCSRFNRNKLHKIHFCNQTIDSNALIDEFSCRKSGNYELVEWHLFQPHIPVYKNEIAELVLIPTWTQNSSAFDFAKEITYPYSFVLCSVVHPANSGARFALAS